MKRLRISRSDFSFVPAGYGHYRITYTSPVTRKTWAAIIDNMPLLDATKNTQSPKICDLKRLKSLVKKGREI